MEIEFQEEASRIVAIDKETNTEVGELTFTRTGADLASFDHTFVDPICRGQNLAERLLNEAADLMRREKRKVISRCSYVSVKFERDAQQYADIKCTE